MQKQDVIDVQQLGIGLTKMVNEKDLKITAEVENRKWGTREYIFSWASTYWTRKNSILPENVIQDP